MLSYVLVYGLLAFIQCQDVVFPASIEPTGERHQKKREPLFAPSICPENHLLYPGNQDNDWICDCAPGFVYYPDKDGCFPTYRQGPCPNGQYLMLKRGEFLPTCVKNPCGTDGLVQYRGVCHELNKPGGPCKPKNNETVGILAVTKSTLELRCISGPTPLVLIKVPNNSCPPGSRRSNSNDCRFGISEDDNGEE